MDKEKYNYWREVQRNQLGISANLFMIFASAILGYLLNLLNTNENLKCPEKTILVIAGVFLIISLILYGLFTLNRLNDFRDTAKLTKAGKSERTIGILTKKDGECTWYLFQWQLRSLGLGFAFSVIGLGIIIFLKNAL